ncbi:hypothetical protein SORBI_3008G139200 [Sorghum bicolor]|uniref:Uncharacterized protein n=1 Tax=Sorghum bicolor TaxID=4558 RepID=A0A1B6PDS3_SORBI|nr:hypothetical protein SORBI_3008G139200 [Sorghum bicolor]
MQAPDLVDTGAWTPAWSCSMGVKHGLRCARVARHALSPWLSITPQSPPALPDLCGAPWTWKRMNSSPT